MLNQEIIIKRLALIKYLYKVGLDQSMQSEHLASLSILSFHDSIEMFLKLLTEKENIKSDKFSFIEYWNNIPKLTLKESMSNLNTRRVNIKHKGLLPSKTEIEASRVNTTDFFSQNTPLFFDLEFRDISLFSLIDNTAIRNKLEESQQALELGKYDDSIASSAITFAHLLYTYEKNKYANSRESPFNFGTDFSWSSNYKSQLDRKLDDILENMANSISALQSVVKIISLGIDYKRYIKFNLLTPNISRTMGGKYVVQIWNEKQWTKENCQYCIDFVLDSCLKLQEFDFDIRTIENKETLEYYNARFRNFDEEDKIESLSSPDDLIIK